MLIVPTIVKPSRIHGLGVFALERIPFGCVVWQFNHAVDHTMSRSSLHLLPEIVQKTMLDRCYVNPARPEYLVICSDNAAFMNFSEKANTRLGPPVIAGEWALIAEDIIEEGDEITVPFASDADAARKLGLQGERELISLREVSA